MIEIRTLDFGFLRFATELDAVPVAPVAAQRQVNQGQALDRARRSLRLTVEEWNQPIDGYQSNGYKYRGSRAAAG